MSNKKIEETIIIRNSKMVYAVRLKSKMDEKSGSRIENSNPYIVVENGKVQFLDNTYCSKSEFDFSNEVHQIAKEIFVCGLRTAIKQSVLELKQLQLVFDEMNLSECFGSVLVDNSKMLLEIKDKINENSVGTKAAVGEAIRDSVKPIALKKSKDGEPHA